jgi:DNA-binding transcriptional MerR regulator
MEKSAEAFRSIGEMAEQLGVKTHILRYWEEQFPMLQPLKRAGGRRHYRPQDVDLLKTIHRLLGHEGYTIKGARQFLSRGGKIVEAPAPLAATPVPAANAFSAATPDLVPTSQLAPVIPAHALTAIRDKLVRALETA